MMSMLDRYRRDIREFQDAMEYKLRVHQDKGHWEGANPEEMMGRLAGEVAELQEAIDEGNSIEIMLEAADVANFAMIIQWIARHEHERHEIADESGQREAVAYSDDQPAGVDSGASIFSDNAVPSSREKDDLSGWTPRWAIDKSSNA